MVTAVGTVSTENSVLFFVASCFYRHIAPHPSILLTADCVFRFNVHNQILFCLLIEKGLQKSLGRLLCVSNDRRIVILTL
jgi:hypothetical protein